MTKIFSFKDSRSRRFKCKKIEHTKPYTEEDTAYREFVLKLRKIKDTMLTPEGRRMAEGRHNFMKKFFSRLEREINGKV